MQYFVSIEDRKYFHWQIELLIESFKMLNMEDDLVIGIAMSKFKDSIFSKNLSKHKNVFYHPNYGRSKGCVYLNKFFSVVHALNTGLLKQPFAFLHPDMILARPIPEQQDNIVFSYTEIDPMLQTDLNYNAPHLGNVICFKDVPISFFTTAMDAMEKNLSNEWKVDQIGWMSAVANHQNLKYKADNLECALMQYEITPIIHYKHGMPAEFSKFYYWKNPEFNFSIESPYDILLRLNPTVCSNVLHNTVKSYKGIQ